MSKDFENNEFSQEPNNFRVPENYFNDSAQNIANRIEWLEEHKAYEMLTKLKGAHGFTTPENYFEESGCRLELLEYPVLFGITRTNAFTVPQNYFEDAEVRELEKAMLDTTDELASFEILRTLEKKNTFEVKENYFETNQTKLEKELGTGAKVISLFRANTWYSAAAAALVIAIGTWLYTNYFKPAEKDCTSLACIEKSELLKLKNIENVDSDELFEMVDTKKLEEVLDLPAGEAGKKEEPSEKGDSLSGITSDDLPDDI